MKHKMIVLLTVIAFSASLASGQQVAKISPLPELLEKAIFTEETVGDLDAAIELYREIIAQAEASKPVVAEARFRLAWPYFAFPRIFLTTARPSTGASNRSGIHGCSDLSKP